MTSGKTALIVVAVAGLSFVFGRWSSQLQLSVTPSVQTTTPIIRETLTTQAPAISEAEAKDLRASSYDSVDSISKVLDLPTDYAQTEALYILAGRASQSELEELISQAVSIADRRDRRAAIQVLFSRYAELDANAAVDYLVAINLDISEQILPTIFDEWSKNDLNGAIAKANSLVNMRERKSASRAILMATARYNESLIDTVAASLIDSDNVEQIHGEAITARANTDPVGALQEALSLTGLSGRYGTVWKVARVWARNDPAGALQSIDLIKDAGMRDHFVGQVVERWIQDAPEQAIQYINAQTDVQARNMMLKRALGVYAQSNPENAMSLAVEMTGQAGAQALQQVMMSWANTDPAAAMLALSSIENSTKRNRIVQQVGQSLTSQGSDKTFAWLDALDSETRSSQMGSILRQVAQHEPRRALEYVMANSDEANLGSSLMSVLYSASISDPTIVEDYVVQLPAGTNTDNLYQKVAGNLAMNDQQAALRWIEGLSGTAKVNALKGAVLTMTQSDPNYAATLISQLPDDAVSDVFQQVGVRMGQHDPAGALAWLEQFRGRSGYDVAVSEVIQSAAYSDPRGAAALARQVSTANESVYGAVASAWARSDPRQATSWALSLPPGGGRDHALGNLIYAIPADIASLSNIVSSITSEAQRASAIRRGYKLLLGKQNNQTLANAFLDEVGAEQQLREQLQGRGR